MVFICLLEAEHFVSNNNVPKHVELEDKFENKVD